jgi:hypothetical protein
MKFSSLLQSAAVITMFAAGVFALAQAPPDQPPVPGAAQQSGPPGGGRPMRNFPAPTNLKVLPKDTTGKQIHEIMETWAGSLGVHCDTCHMADPKNIGPNGRPRLNFADDSKSDKQIARIMYTMTQQINTDYISKAIDMDKDGEGSPVTCGTCHRGQKMPETFVVPKEEGPGGPGGGQGMPPMPGMPAGGTAPPAVAAPPPAN